MQIAREFIATVSAEFADASHNCWAYMVGPPGSTSQVGMSDAGEPHGTAGRPMLNVLLHADLGDVAVVVTRYFGGTLLGKGGLVKAYSGGVQLALASLPTVDKVTKTELFVVIDYASVTPIQRILSTYEVEVIEQEYGVDVTFKIRLPEEHVSPFCAHIVDLTHGQALVDPIEEDLPG